MLGLPALSDDALVAFYAPYCGGLEREDLLRTALTQLGLCTLTGARAVSGGSAHHFELTWSQPKAPLESIQCLLRFPAQPTIQYDFDVATQQPVAWLMDRADAGTDDLPDAFWTWLLTGADPTSDHA